MPAGRIDSGEAMLAIANAITNAVVTGKMTLNEAHEFRNFLRIQKHMIEDAENKIRIEEWRSKQDDEG